MTIRAQKEEDTVAAGESFGRSLEKGGFYCALRGFGRGQNGICARTG